MIDQRNKQRLDKLKALIEEHAWQDKEARVTKDAIYSYLCAWENEDAERERATILWRECMETGGHPKTAVRSE